MKISFKGMLIFFCAVILSSCTSRSDALNDKIESLRKFGTDPFDQQKWSVSNEMQRGRMIYDFLKKNSPITGKDRKFILSNLGENTGYYNYDHFPAYYVGPKPPDSYAKAYLVAFVIDHKTENIINIYIEPEIE